jgi:hypothetical protein
MQLRRSVTNAAIAVSALCLLGHCAHTGSEQAATRESDGSPAVDTSDVVVAMPAETTEARDDHEAPILRIATAGAVVYPYVYGYPLYPEGDAARGIQALRAQNAAGAVQGEREDAAGVVHAVEMLPQLGCHFEGVREDRETFVPVSLTCDLPSPKSLGGSKRPVLGKTLVGARPEQILREPSVQEIFFGAFHLTSDDFASGSGMAYFNTTHGQLALVFAQKKLTSFVYYFDPNVKGWKNPASWTKP